MTTLLNPIRIPRPGEARRAASRSYWDAVERRAASKNHAESLRVFERAIKQQSAMPPICSAPDCPHHAVAKGLCATHYRRQLRAGKRKADLAVPVRRRDLVRIAGPRVTPECAAALEREARNHGVPVYRVAADVLEEWARLRMKGKEE